MKSSAFNEGYQEKLTGELIPTVSCAPKDWDDPGF